MKKVSLIVLLVLLLPLLVLLYITSGEYPVSLSDVFNPNDPVKNFIIKDLRLPRMIIVICTGAALAVSGAFLQGIFRNPLAEPSILGISQAAALGATLAIFIGDYDNQIYISSSAAIFAIGASFLFILLAKIIGDFSNTNIIITGIAINLLCSSIISLIIYLSLPFYETSRQILYWIMGNFEGKGWNEVLYVAPVTIAGIIFLLTHSEILNILTLDDIQATSLGVDVINTRNRILFVIAIMVAASASIVGTMAFIGLIIPHLIRITFGSDYRKIVPLCLLLGPLFLLGIDTLARTVFAPYQIQAGTIASLLGAPLIIIILLTKKAWI